MDFLTNKWFYFSLVISAVVLFAIVRNFSNHFFPLIKDGFVQGEVLKKGIAVNADIVSAQQTTMWGGNKPIYKMTFKFKTVQNQVVEASILKDLTFEEIERFKPGNGTTIKYDPKNPQRIALYDKPLVLER
ncbi:DUF3592 domain-containing protein [Pantoea allii]|uniref:DUF3592 domain-containing protein n=1 Tax=Pantoea allii TaxID=574096 RepID=UPI003D311CE3